MITGEIKNKIDQIWDTFFVAGITNPITVLEQMTYIFFMKMLDDKQLQDLANVPSREVLLGRLFGSMQSPIANFARVIKQIAEPEGEGDAAEAPAAE